MYIHVYALRILWICAICNLECLTSYRMAHIFTLLRNKLKGSKLHVCSLCHSSTHYYKQDHCLCSYTLDSSSSSSRRKRTSVIEGGNTRLRKEEEPGVKVQKPEELEVLTQNFISVNKMYSSSLSEVISYTHVHVYTCSIIPSTCKMCGVRVCSHNLSSGHC